MRQFSYRAKKELSASRMISKYYDTHWFHFFHLKFLGLYEYGWNGIRVSTGQVYVSTCQVEQLLYITLLRRDNYLSDKRMGQFPSSL